MAEENEDPNIEGAEEPVEEVVEQPPEAEEPEQDEPENPKKKKAKECPACEAGAPAWMAKLADMATEVEAARMLCLKAAWLKDQGKSFDKESAMAKLYASRVANDIAREAVQVHGGYGYVKEYHVERLMRDAKITEIYEGTTEIQKIVISRMLLQE